MKDITESELDAIENFAKKELDQLLLGKCTRSDTSTLSDLDKEHFFGLYASSATEFKLLRGERKLILKIANHLTELFEKGREEFKKNFDVLKRFKLCKNDTVMTPVGLFYGKRFRKYINYAGYTHDELKSVLFAKLKPFFASFTNLKPVYPITENVITIVDLRTGYRADVVCVFCQSNECDIEVLLKKIAVQWDGGWNLTNFKKHIVSIHLKGKLLRPMIVTDELNLIINQKVF